MNGNKKEVVYVLHFSAPISPNHTCQHYVGYATDLAHRIEQHRNGTGARLTQVAKERNITFNVVAVYEGGRALERRIKNIHGSRVCPCCSNTKHPSLDSLRLQDSQILDLGVKVGGDVW